MTDQATELPTIAPFLKRDGDKPYLAGSKCRACGHVFVGDRTVCAKCAARGQMEAVHLAETGKVYVHTVVYRSFPGVETPFIDVIVDLDDGAHIKGTLREAAPVNKPGQPYLTYAFEPL